MNTKNYLFVHFYRVSSVGRDSIIRLWELDSGQELSCNHITASGPLTDLVSPEEGMYVIISYINVLIISNSSVLPAARSLVEFLYGH